MHVKGLRDLERTHRSPSRITPIKGTSQGRLPQPLPPARTCRSCTHRDVSAAFPGSANDQPEFLHSNRPRTRKAFCSAESTATAPHGAGSAGRPLAAPRRRLLLRAGSALSRSRSAASFWRRTVSQKEATAFQAVSSASIASTTLGRERSSPILWTRIPRSSHHAEHCSNVCCAESRSHPQWWHCGVASRPILLRYSPKHPCPVST